MTNQGLDLAGFAKELIIKAGFGDLPEDFQKEMRLRVGREALNRMGLLIAAELAEDKLKEYGALVAASPNPAADANVANFIQTNIPDFQQKVQQVLAGYEEEFIAEAKKSLVK